jgi:nitrogen-specific signal transduction histidine kinase
MKNMPIDYFEFYTTVNPFAEGYYKIGKKEEARKILNQLMKKHQEKITFFNSQSEKQKAFYAREINDEIKRYYMLLLIAEENNDVEYHSQQIVKFRNYNKMMGDYGINID